MARTDRKETREKMAIYSSVREAAPTISRESIWLAGICAADTVLTAILLSMGMIREANPLMAYLINYGIGTFCAVKMMMVVPVVALSEWYRRYNPVFVRRSLMAGIIAYTAIYFASVLAVNLS